MLFIGDVEPAVKWEFYLETIGAIIGALLMIYLFSGCALPAAATLIPEATAAASALSGHGLTINVMSNNQTCNCGTCHK